MKALSPIYRALFKDSMRHAGLLGRIDPQVWKTNWNVHSQANPNGTTAFTYLAPYVFRVAISNRRIVSRKDRTVTYRKPGSSRPRPTSLDVLEFIRRFLQHGLPDGFVKVRHFGCLHPSCAVSIDILRSMRVQAHPNVCQPIEIIPPKLPGTLCPTCGTSMHVVMRLWTSNKIFVDPS